MTIILTHTFNTKMILLSEYAVHIVPISAEEAVRLLERGYEQSLGNSKKACALQKLYPSLHIQYAPVPVFIESGDILILPQFNDITNCSPEALTWWKMHFHRLNTKDV